MEEQQALADERLNRLYTYSKIVDSFRVLKGAADLCNDQREARRLLDSVVKYNRLLTTVPNQ
jgi:hypothetical protein